MPGMLLWAVRHRGAWLPVGACGLEGDSSHSGLLRSLNFGAAGLEHICQLPWSQ